MKAMDKVRRFMETETSITHKDRLVICGGTLILTGMALVLNYKNCIMKIDKVFDDIERDNLKMDISIRDSHIKALEDEVERLTLDESELEF